MSKPVIAYGSEENQLIELVQVRNAIEDRTSPEWRSADDAVQQFFGHLPLERRADRIGNAIAFLKAQEQQASDEIRRLEAWKRDSVKARLAIAAAAQDVMVMVGARKLPGYTRTLSLVPNPPKVVIHDEALVPNEFKEINVNFHYSNWLLLVARLPDLTGRLRNISKPEPIKSLIKIALDAGDGVPGCSMEQEFRVDAK